MKRVVLAIVLVGFSARTVLAQTFKPREVTDEDIERVIDETKRYLYSTRNRETGLWADIRHHADTNIKTGVSALAAYALLEAGEHPQYKPLKAALDALVKVRINNTYTVAARVMALSLAVPQVKDSPYRPVLKNDVKWLVHNAARYGAWGYNGAEKDGDNSCSQLALLALWEADRAVIPIPNRLGLMRRLEGVWVRRQRKDGGWMYSAPGIEGTSTVSMASAGLASLYICRDVASLASGRYGHQKTLDQGWDYLAKNLKPSYVGDGYLAFCVQRVGMATGRKFLGKMDWFEVGAKALCTPDPYGKTYRGKWGSVVRASFELIFLARGRIPLTYNKLRYGLKPENWNYHSRDIPRFTEYMRRNFEKRMRWQVVRLTDDVQRFLDAPILMISGTEPLAFKKAQWAKLREYALRGGMLLFVATRNSRPFLDSVHAGLKDLFKVQRELVGEYYTLEKLPNDHKLYDVHKKISPDKNKQVPVLWGVSDGTRLLAIVSDEDIAASWQRYERRSGHVNYALGSNIYFYATGGNPMRSRMRPVFAGTGKTVRHVVRVGWLKHGGNWCTQPHALKYTSEKLTAENRVAIDLAVGVRIEPERLKKYHLLWLTAARDFSLTETQIKALRDYMLGGGMLFVNAIGGSVEAHRAAREMLDKIRAGTDIAEGLVSPESPLMTGKCGDFRGPKLTDIQLLRTKAWQRESKASDLKLRLYEKGGRLVAAYGRYGIHDTLDGHAGTGARSYLPTTARQIAANIVLYSLVYSKPEGPPSAVAEANTAKK